MKMLSTLGIELLCCTVFACTIALPVRSSLIETNLEKIEFSAVENDFYVVVEFVVFKQEIEKYPVSWQNFQKAVNEWALHVPIKIALYIEDPDNFHPLFGPMTYRHRYNIITVHLDDLQAPVYGYQPGILGIWDSEELRVLLDAESLEKNPAQAYVTALHEVGHMLGVPHIINDKQSGHTGIVMLPEELNAREYIMYPFAGPENQDSKLSELEIRFAVDNVKNNRDLFEASSASHSCKR